MQRAVFFLLMLLAFFLAVSGECLCAFKGKRFYVPPFDSAPVSKGVNQAVPPELGNLELAKLGLVDVTAKPFSADPMGKKDSTKSLQQAVKFASDHQMATFFPSGTYLISDTIECVQDYRDVGDGRVLHACKFPCVLIGSRKGQRPKIVLAPNSLGYQDPSKLKYVIHFYARMDKDLDESPLQPNLSMNQMLINIDVTIGQGNPGAVAVRHRCAEGSGLQDCTIDATHGHTGLEGGAGSGGSFAAVSIIGGTIGMDLTETQPAPTISGVTLINQTERAILYGGRQSLSAVGVKIVSEAKGPIIEGRPYWLGPHFGQIALVDCEIICEHPNSTSISSKSSLYLKNVYIHGAVTAVAGKGETGIPGSRKGWIHVREYAKGVSPKKWEGIQFEAPVFINGIREEKTVKDFQLGTPPSPDFQSRHLWKEDEFPHFESDKALNVKRPPYSAKGDGKADDTEAIQRAINQNEIVFLPKGYYRVTKTLQLKPNTKLIGIAKHLSVLLVTHAEGDFSHPSVPRPIVQSAAEKNADTILAFLEIFVPVKPTGAFALDWRSGGNSIIRDVNFSYGVLRDDMRKKIKYQKSFPLVTVTQTGGGKWYNFNHGSKKHHGPGYRHILVQGVSGPLSFYQCCPQHASSEANMEIRGSKHVSIFGLKGESRDSPILLVKNSDYINVYGYGGNAHPKEGQSLFLVEDTNNFLIVNAVDTPASFKTKEDGGPWHMIIEKRGDKLIRTMPFDRPVMYKAVHLGPVKHFQIRSHH